MDERTFDDFDVYADEYRSIHTRNIKLSGADSFYFAKMKVDLLIGKEKNNVSQVLDVGCGDGATEIFMTRSFPQWSIHGIDTSVKSIQAAIAANVNNCSFSVYNGSTIPFADNIFDVVFIAGVLHHVNFDLHHVIIKEIRRVLKNGGRMYLFEHNPFNPVTKHLVNTCVFDKNARLLSSRYTKSLLKENQLTITNTTFIIFFPRKGILSKLIFLEKYLNWLPLGGQYFISAIKQN